METRIRKLYDRFLEGKATKEEINEIYDRITATPEELKEFREYEKFWEQIHKPSEEVLASLADVKATIKSYKRRRAWRFVSAVSAASPGDTRVSSSPVLNRIEPSTNAVNASPSCS